MQVYVIFNGQQYGPYQMDELRRMPVTPQTPVWYEGLPDWTEAGMAPATRLLFEAPQPAPSQALCDDRLPDPPYPDGTCDPLPEPPYPAENSGPLPEPPYPMDGAGEPTQCGPENCQPRRDPGSYMAISILLTIFCCLPFGIVACIKSAGVSDCLAKGDYDGAWRNSRSALTWIWVSLICGVLCYVGLLIFGFSLGAAAAV